MRPVHPAGARLAPHPAGRQGAPLVTLALLLGVAAAGTSAIAAEDAGPACARETCRYAGRPLVAALEDLRVRGLNLIFSSDLVRPELIVETEPPIAAPRQMLARLLAPFGLEARDGPAGTVLVVRSASSSSDESDGAEPDGAARDDLPLRTQPALREEVRVGTPTVAEASPVTTLKQDDIDRAPGVGNDAARSVAWLPGIASADKSAELSIRGGENDETT